MVRSDVRQRSLMIEGYLRGSKVRCCCVVRQTRRRRTARGERKKKSSTSMKGRSSFASLARPQPQQVQICRSNWNAQSHRRPRGVQYVERGSEALQ
jgi:hypothetical protein